MQFIRTSLALVALAFAVPFAGCASDADSTVEQASVGKAEQALGQDLTTVAAIQADPAFHAFFQSFRETTAPFMQRGMTMPPQAQQQFIAGLQQVQCSPGCPQLNQYLSQFGMQVDPSRLVQVMHQEEQLRARGATQANLVHAMINFGGIDYQIHPVDPGQYNQNPDYGACLEDCAIEFAYATYLAMSAYFTSMVGCAALTVGWPACVAVATAAYAFAMWQANKALEGCQSRCEDICDSSDPDCGSGSSTLNQACSYDSECASSEHCNTILQGFPGKCKADFSRGHACARNSWCTSNNCNWAFCAP